MVTRRDLLKMGLIGAGSMVTLPAGGWFGRVSSAFADSNLQAHV